MINSGVLGNPVKKQNVLISINALIDIDVGLFRLIQEEYLDPQVFNEDFFQNSTIVDFIKTTYFRKDDNPLLDVAIIDDKDTLMEYYAQFNNEMYNEIYDRSTYTDVLPMLYLFLDSGDIDITILYYKDYCKEQLEKDIEDGTLPKDVKLLSIKELSPRILNTFTSIYVRSIFEIEKLPVSGFTSPKCFYISSFGPNFNKDGNLKRYTVLNKIVTGKLMHEINVFEMYTKENVRVKEGDN